MVLVSEPVRGRSRATELPCFSGNIANIIPGSPLKKMIPLMEDHGGGGGCMGPPLAYGIICVVK